MTISQLDRFALDSWQSVLYSLVGQGVGSQKMKVVDSLLERSGLMGATASGLKITSKGFQFLLLDM
jgi:Transcription factor Tfb2